jgi:F-type H+-transporting ATPase subunit a
VLAILAELEFPSIDLIVEWPSFVGEDQFWGINKIALNSMLAVVLTALLFLIGSKTELVSRSKMRNLAEMSVDLIDKGVIQQTIGHGGEKYLPFLATIFFFVFFGNIFGIIPGWQMPANARMANPIFMGVLTLVFFVAVGLKAQGPKYFINACFPPGVPKALYLLVAPIEFLSTFIVRPFSLAVRLFANLLAGHILLVTFGVLCITLAQASPLAVVLPFSFFMLAAMTGFELMVAFLQAYVFAVLAAVYIGGAAHPEH